MSRSLVSWSSVVLALLAACGGGGDDGIDDGVDPPDADQTPDAIPVGAVDVTTEARSTLDGPPGTTVAGVELVSLDADGALRDRATSDGDGMAALEVQLGGSVTAIYPVTSLSRRSLVTYVGVAPGDRLRFGRNYDPVGSNAEAGTMTVSWTPHDGAAGYQLESLCGPFSAEAPPLELVRYERCGAPTTDLLLTARDADGAVLAYAFIADTTFLPNSELDLGALTEAPTFTLDVEGAPADLASYVVELQALVDERPGLPIALGGAIDGPDLVDTAPIPVTDLGHRAYTRVAHDNGVSLQQVYQRLAPDTFTLQGPDLLPWVSEVTVDPGAAHVGWAVAGDGTVDASTAVVYYAHDAVELDWGFIAPGDVDGLAIPPLPEELAALAPRAGDPIDLYVGLVDADVLNEYAEVRNAPEWFALQPHRALPGPEEAWRVRISTGVPADE
jgi:hypothetical protein